MISITELLIYSFIILIYIATYVGERYVAILGEVSRCIYISLPPHSETNCTKLSKLWVRAQSWLIKQNATQKKPLKTNLFVDVTLISEAKLASWSNFHTLVCFFAKMLQLFLFFKTSCLWEFKWMVLFQVLWSSKKQEGFLFVCLFLCKLYFMK